MVMPTTLPKPLAPLEQRIAEKVSMALAPSMRELAGALKQTNNQLAQLIEQNKQFRSDTAIWRKESEEHRVAVINSLTEIVNKFIISLSNLGLPTKNPEFVASHKLTVTTAGTAVPFPPLKIPYGHEVTIKALAGNTGTVYIGHSKPDAEDHSIAFPLEISEAVEAKIENLKTLWLDADNASDGVSWIVEVEK